MDCMDMYTGCQNSNSTRGCLHKVKLTKRIQTVISERRFIAGGEIVQKYVQFCGSAFYFGMQARARARTHTHTYTPVSYTHLDVYKRQQLMSVQILINTKYDKTFTNMLRICKTLSEMLKRKVEIFNVGLNSEAEHLVYTLAIVSLTMQRKRFLNQMNARKYMWGYKCQRSYSIESADDFRILTVNYRRIKVVRSIL